MTNKTIAVNELTISPLAFMLKLVRLIKLDKNIDKYY
jgi:hypothetical protein